MNVRLHNNFCLIDDVIIVFYFLFPISHLYFHYYHLVIYCSLRTSDCSYLNEACNFYAAIRSRGYYNIINKDGRAGLIIKKLRYYARYIVVGLLLKKMKLVRDLVREFGQTIMDYHNSYEPDSQLEWSLVLQEIKAFIEAESLVTIIGPDSAPVTIGRRLGSHSNIPPAVKTPTSNLFLYEAIIVGNCQRQIKFSELTVDMFRMLQILEREPNDKMEVSSPTTIFRPGSSIAAGYLNNRNDNAAFNNLRKPNNNNNSLASPLKYALYKPTFSQLYLVLASGFKELPQNGVLLLYLSADGCFPVQTNDAEDLGYDFGGVVTSSKRASNNQNNELNNTRSQSIHFKQMNCLHPGDLYPFLRKPLIVIVDSDNSYAFQHVPRHFGLPLLVLMSPSECPAPFNDNLKGSLFTMFLHCPITALCIMSNIIELSEHDWRESQAYLDKFNTELGKIVMQSRSIHPTYVAFFADDFLRSIIFRFIFCFIVMKTHRLFKTNMYAPRAQPNLPEMELIHHPILRQILTEITIVLDIRNLFEP